MSAVCRTKNASVTSLHIRKKELWLSKHLFICKNVEATAEFVDGFKPDIVVNATGSNALLPDIKGLKENLEKGNVSTIFDLVDNVKSYEQTRSRR